MRRYSSKVPPNAPGLKPVASLHVLVPRDDVGRGVPAPRAHAGGRERAPQALLVLAHHLLERATLGDVVRDGDDGDDLARVVAHRRDARVHEHGRAVLAAGVVVARPRLALARCASLIAAFWLRRLGVEEVGDPASDRLGGRPPEQGLGAGVPRHHDTVAVEHRDRVVDRVEDAHLRQVDRRHRSRPFVLSETKSFDCVAPHEADTRVPSRSRDWAELSSRPARCLRRCRRTLVIARREQQSAVDDGCDDGSRSVTPCPIPLHPTSSSRPPAPTRRGHAR